MLLTYSALTAAAETAGRAAEGAGAVTLGDGLRRRFEFRAVEHEDGTVTGYINFKDPTEIPEQDVDRTGEPGLEAVPEGLEVTVEVDSLKVEGRRAALGGVVSSTNLPRYVGLRFLLAVEDCGDGAPAAARDRIAWGVYRPAAPERTAADADSPESGESPVAEPEVDAARFPLVSHTLSKIAEGDIRVSPDPQAAPPRQPEVVVDKPAVLE